MPAAWVGAAVGAAGLVNTLAGGGSSGSSGTGTATTNTGTTNTGGANTSGYTNNGNGGIASPLVQVGNVAGSGTAAQGYLTAAQQEALASQQAATMAGNQLATTTQNFAPYTTAGATAANQLNAQLPSLTAAFNPTQAGLEATPGYQFTLSQGLKATQNSATARGLGVSGTALQAGDAYATGLADTTYNQQFQNYLNQQQASYNKLLGTSQLGTQATGALGQLGQQATQLGSGYTSDIGKELGIGTQSSAAILAGQQNAWGAALGQTLGSPAVTGALGTLGKSIGSGINSLFQPGTTNGATTSANNFQGAGTNANNALDANLGNVGVPATGAYTNNYAEGGVPPVGRVALVGEHGPELFIPHERGTVIPAPQTRNLLMNPGAMMGRKHLLSSYVR